MSRKMVPVLAGKAVDGQRRVVSTTFLISNLHCPTCVSTIASSLDTLRPKPLDISSSILSHSVTVTHDISLPVSRIPKALEDAAFEVYSVEQDHNTVDVDLEKGHGGNAGGVLQRRWSFVGNSGAKQLERERKRHIEQCAQCQSEQEEQVVGQTTKVPSRVNEKGDEVSSTTRGPLTSEDSSGTADVPFVVIDSDSGTPNLYKASLSIGGMTCSSCVGAISDGLSQREWVKSVDVNLINNSATVSFEGKEHVPDIVGTVEDLGYEASVEEVEDLSRSPKTPPQPVTDSWKATFAIGGMTCSSCVAAITNAVQEQDWVDTVDVNLISNSTTVVFRGGKNLSTIKQIIEDAGYEATIDEFYPEDYSPELSIRRKVAIKVSGMYCAHCPTRISDSLSISFGDKVEVEKLPIVSDPILRLSYVPQGPGFTIRNIMDCIAAADEAFQPSIYHPPSLEQRSQEMRAREQRRLLYRLALSVIIAIPTFVIGIVLMSLVNSDNPNRKYIMEPMWAGNVPRAQWALFILATPVYFFAADVFHLRAVKELRAMWGPKSTIPILRRFYRFGSMSLLISLGTTIAYFSSIAELAIAATEPPDVESMTTGSSYFDSVVFLTMFLLIGRFLEAYSKAKTGDAVTLLGKLRPSEAILVDGAYFSDSTQNRPQSSAPNTRKIPVDLLEVGDIVKVSQGASPPADGIVVQGETQFDESSLTGESRLVRKQIGDEVFAGTVNKADPISVRVSSISGTSMLDQIVKVVREGQAKRAPIERVADVITSHFVPFVVLIGVSTWIIWLALGLSGALPESYRDTTVGGWPLWSLQFSIAVFVIACPCGIGLAAPTALFVGGGLAAKYGVLVKGGGEAFQEASALDVIVFDKTGTLTEGGAPSVTDYECLTGDSEARLLGMVRGLEQDSSHPIARALVSLCDTKAADRVEISEISEIPGKGMQGTVNFRHENHGKVSILLGNEALMADYNIYIPSTTATSLETWKTQGKSVALLATSQSSLSEADNSTTYQQLTYTLSAIFAIADPLRPEALSVIRALQKRSIEIYMLTGDHPTTAYAIGAQLGIPTSNIIAGVLPSQKADQIKSLQQSSIPRRSKFWNGTQKKRATVAMLGDGINDAPALTAADVSIAIGSGSDVAISSASFVLMTSRLTSLLVLIDLSRAVFKRVRVNFAWALVYNLIALPVAAGVLYPIVTGGGGHVRLDPVWASLAMALSSVSVVCSSLVLRTRWWGVGFRVKDREGVEDKSGDEVKK